MSLYNTYRPTSLEEIQGNTSAKRSLSSIIERGEIPHAVLLQGPRGCGKTTLARIMAKELKCDTIDPAHSMDLQELDIGSFGGVAEVKSLKRKVYHKPMNGPVRVWILDEAHGLKSEQARNAMLKVLEEPPSYVYFFLCTTDPQKLTATIKSRCTPISVGPLNEKQTIRWLKKICQLEQTKVPNSVLREVYNASLGHPRDALSILETILGLDPEDMEGAALEEASKRNAGIELARAIWKGEDWEVIASILKGIDEEPETVRRICMGYFNTILLSGNEAAAVAMEPFYEKNTFDCGKPGLTMMAFAAYKDLQ